jgi:hypothetical protein
MEIKNARNYTLFFLSLMPKKRKIGPRFFPFEPFLTGEKQKRKISGVFLFCFLSPYKYGTRFSLFFTLKLLFFLRYSHGFFPTASRMYAINVHWYLP